MVLWNIFGCNYGAPTGKNLPRDAPTEAQDGQKARDIHRLRRERRSHVRVCMVSGATPLTGKAFHSCWVERRSCARISMHGFPCVSGGTPLPREDFHRFRGERRSHVRIPIGFGKNAAFHRYRGVRRSRAWICRRFRVERRARARISIGCRRRALLVQGFP